jgi:hypothetical protein
MDDLRAFTKTHPTVSNGDVLKQIKHTGETGSNLMRMIAGGITNKNTPHAADKGGGGENMSSAARSALFGSVE